MTQIMGVIDAGPPAQPFCSGNPMRFNGRSHVRMFCVERSAERAEPHSSY